MAYANNDGDRVHLTLLIEIKFCHTQIYGLARRAQTYNLQLVPVPADPHALPYALKSDPLRGPIFVPINFSSISTGK